MIKKEMIRVDVLTNKLDTCYVSSTRHEKKNYTNIIVCQTKNFVGICYVNFCSEKASGICNPYFQGDSLF